ncbi:MAG: hypothetical protein LBU73_06325 [Helicobacteraceae bacterium]|nr:hypothetical protein [Helicobacteraceae bacterium]
MIKALLFRVKSRVIVLARLIKEEPIKEWIAGYFSQLSVATLAIGLFQSNAGVALDIIFWLGAFWLKIKNRG